VIHELSFGIQRLADGRRKEQVPQLSAEPALFCGLPLLVTRNISDFVAFDGLQLLKLVSPCPQSPLRQLVSLRWILFRRSASGLRLEDNAWNSTASQKPRANDPRCSASSASIREPWLACRHFLVLISP